MIAPFNPGFVVLLVMGIFFLGAVPPIGIILIIAAIVSVRRYRRERSDTRLAAHDKARQAQQQRKDAAALRLAR